MKKRWEEKMGNARRGKWKGRILKWVGEDRGEKGASPKVKKESATGGVRLLLLLWECTLRQTAGGGR